MGSYKPSELDKWARLFMAGGLCGAMSLFAAGMAFAQDSAQQQLPPAAADQQIPPSFPDVNEPQAAPEGANVLTDDATPSDTAAENNEASDDEQISAPKSVPATAMGTAAQDAQNKNATPPEPEQALAPATPVPNPVEDAAAAAPALPDILEKYTARSEELSAELPLEGEDALPDVGAPPLSDLVLTDDGGASLPMAKTQQQLQQEIRSEAYDAAVTGTFPMSPEQIKSLLKRYDETQKVVETPIYDAPKPEITVQNISLDPGVLPPTVKTAVGNVTTINMLDATGAPWPVQDVTWAGDFEVVEPEEGGHIIRITPMAQFARGNIVIRLLTLKTPLTMTLETSRDVVQYRVDARIPEYGPFASAPLMQGAKSTLVAGSPDLTSLLDGVMPGGMSKLQVGGVDGRTTAYIMGGTTYVRTPLTLLSPAWQSSVSSADGMNVYALSNAPVLLLSDGGEFLRATLQEKEDLLDE